LSCKERLAAGALGAILLALAAALGGCTNHCETRLVECQYDCSRLYQSCIIAGADQEECAKPYRRCWAACTNERNYCRQ
jgi:hypothetical protein